MNHIFFFFLCFLPVTSNAVCAQSKPNHRSASTGTKTFIKAHVAKDAIQDDRLRSVVYCARHHFPVSCHETNTLKKTANKLLRDQLINRCFCLVKRRFLFCFFELITI